MQFVSFDDEHIDQAAALVAARYTEHRRRQPLLSEVADVATLVRYRSDNAAV